VLARAIKNNRKLIEAMIRYSIESYELSREIGFTLCKTKEGRIVPGNLCMGESCRIFLKDCPKGQKIIGTFHTHPVPSGRPNDVLSRGDILASFVSKDEKVACIGSALVEVIPRPPKPPKYGMVVEIFCMEINPETTKKDVERVIEKLRETYDILTGLDSERYEKIVKPYFKVMRLKFRMPRRTII